MRCVFHVQNTMDRQNFYWKQTFAVSKFSHGKLIKNMK